jgi:enoyl-CoA hydratase/carnithine racemase
MLNYTHLNPTIEPRSVVSVTLNRPEVHNAFNTELIAELDQASTRDVLELVIAASLNATIQDTKFGVFRM